VDIEMSEMQHAISSAATSREGHLNVKVTNNEAVRQPTVLISCLFGVGGHVVPPE
jgi:hypothetical protein